MQDQNTYGFNKADAEALLNGLTNIENTFPERVPRDDITTPPDGLADTLERFVMRSNWVGTTALATFTNLSEPAFGTTNGVVEDPLGIFTDILGVGGEGLSIRTRYGRHYVIQAKCDQVETPPVDPIGACSVYTESTAGVVCFQTTEAICELMDGAYGGDGSACS